MYFFIKHMYRWKVARLTTEKVQRVSYSSFLILEHVLQKSMAEMAYVNS
jgi:hypothetical protein